jgi:hypothetical protein
MKDAPITCERIEELLRFLPAPSTPGPGTEPTWHGLDQKPGTSALVMPYPTYPPVVEEFFKLAGQMCWRDSRYGLAAAGELVRSDAAIASASLCQIKTMLTFCVRGERFCDGHWGAMVREGRIGAILRRLQQLRDTVAKTEEAKMAGAAKWRYPERKERELSQEEKEAIRTRIQQGEGDIYQLAQEFGCSSSQVAGIKAAINR